MRSLNTSIASILPVLSLLAIGWGLLGAAALEEFALALFIGMVSGVYSSIFVAAGIAMWLGVKREDLVKVGGGGKELDANDPNAGAVV